MEIPRLSQQQQQQNQPSLGAQPPLPSAHVGGYGNPNPNVPRLHLQNHDRGGMRTSNQIQQNKSRRLYVGNIPYHVGISENGMVQLFSALYVAGFRQLSPGESLPVTSFWLHSDGKFGFMELRGDQEAVDCMQFNGVVLHGRPLRVNRPSDYRPELFGTAHLQPSSCNVTGVKELCDKLVGIVGAPAHLAIQAEVSAQAAQPSQSNGAPNPVTPSATPGAAPQAAPPMLRSQPQAPAPQSSSSPVGVPAPPSNSGPGHPATDPATAPAAGPIAAPLSTPSSASAPTPAGDPLSTTPVAASAAPATDPPQAQKVTVVSLQNMVTDDDLDGRKEEYDDLLEDVKEEGTTHGDLVGVHIPRNGRGRGSVFLAYATSVDANRALSSLKERVFNNKAIDGVLIEDVSSAEEAASQS